MFKPITATDTFEVEVDLSGTYFPGCRETPPSYSHGGLPSEPPSMEDIEVRGLFGLRRVRAPLRERGSHDLVWERFDLLSGVDNAGREKILANIAEFLGDSAHEQLMAALPEAD